jgi:tetratricopeptide (TPR) repeat protein
VGVAALVLTAHLALTVIVIRSATGRPERQGTTPVVAAVTTDYPRAEAAGAAKDRPATDTGGEFRPTAPAEPPAEPVAEQPAPADEAPRLAAPAVAGTRRFADARDRIVSAVIDAQKRLGGWLASAAVDARKRFGGWLALTAPAAPGKAAVPRIILPDVVSVRAGETSTLPVRVRRGGATGPLSLRFEDLPRGVTLRCPTIPAGAEGVEAVVSASVDAAPGEAEVRGSFTVGSDQSGAWVRVRVSPSLATEAYERGRAHLVRGAYGPAVVAFTDAIRLDAHHAGALFSRGIAHHLGRRYRDALNDYTEAIRYRPSAQLYLLRGKVYHELDKNELALADLSEALRLRPGDVDAYLARGEVHHALGRYEQAEADYTEAIRLRPADPAAHYRRGLVRYNGGDNRGAIADFSEVIRLDPSHAWAYRYRGEAYARLGDDVRAGADHAASDRLSTSRPRTGRAGPPAPVGGPAGTTTGAGSP